MPNPATETQRIEIEQHLRQMNDEWVKALVRGDGETTCEGQSEQHCPDQEAKHRRACLVELVQSIQDVLCLVYLRLSDG